MHEDWSTRRNFCELLHWTYVLSKTKEFYLLFCRDVLVLVIISLSQPKF